MNAIKHQKGQTNKKFKKNWPKYQVQHSQYEILAYYVRIERILCPKAVWWTENKMKE